MNNIEKLEWEEHGYPDRVELGKEAINVLSSWYNKLIETGYLIDNGHLIRISDGKDMVLIHNIENQSVSVLPIFSWD